MRTLHEFDRDGRMRAFDAKLSRAMVSEYYGDEIPGWRDLGLAAKRIYRLLRHPDELERGAKTFANLPVLSEHAQTVRPELVVGSTGSNIRYRDGFLVGDIALWARKAIDDVQTRRRPAISLAYRYLPLMFRGRFRGQDYDGVITRMQGTHVSLESMGRCGRECEL